MKVPNMQELIDEHERKLKIRFLGILLCVWILLLMSYVFVKMEVKEIQILDPKEAMREDTTRWTYFMSFKDKDGKADNNILYISKPIEAVQDIQDLEARYNIKIDNIQLLREPNKQKKRKQ